MTEVSNLKQATEVASSSHNAELTLLPARPDFKSPQTQMTFGAIAAVALCFVLYLPLQNNPFSAEDLIHAQYISAAIGGDWSAFLQNLTGSGAGAGVGNYRPLAALSLLIDGFAGRGMPQLFHFTNLLLCAATAYLTGLIALEVTGVRGNRLGAATAVWGACLFAVCPTHFGTVASISARFDLLATFFYLLSLFTYLRFRLIREQWYFKLSLATFACALLCNEIAMTLPAVLFLAEWFLFGPENEHLPKDLRDNRLVQRVSFILSFFFLGSFLSGLHVLVTGTPFGGAVAAALTTKKLLAPSSLFSLLPLHEGSSSGWIVPVVSSGYIVSAAIFTARTMMQSVSFKCICFLIGWIAITAVAALYGGYGYENRGVFFSTSAPVCILLCTLALPSIDIMRKQTASRFSMAGVTALSAILIAWFAAAQDAVQKSVGP